MSWREFLDGAAYPLAAALLLYLGLLSFGAAGYVVQRLMTGYSAVVAVFVRARGRRRTPVTGWLVLIVALVFPGAYIYLAVSELARWFEVPAAGARVVGAAGAAGAILIFIDGLAFAARPRPRPWRLTLADARLPAVFAQLHRSGRLRVALQIYWGSMWAAVPTVVTPLVWIAAVSKANALRPVTPDTFTGMVVGTLAVTAIGVCEVFLSPPSRRLPAAAALVALGGIDHMAKGRTQRPGPISANGDPLAWYRPRLLAIGVLIDREARRLDSATRGLGQHPVAAILRAGAARLRHFATGEQSLVNRLPDDIRELVTTLMVVLAGPARGEPYRELATMVGAFDAEGRSAPMPRRRWPSLETALTRVGQGSEALHKVLILLLLGGVAMLVFLGRIELGDLGGILPP
ncbi:hypothetical protein [Phytohabitans houttuyneae]|nr:hypothetical protein [Phytohabitans houttuyneae]